MSANALPARRRWLGYLIKGLVIPVAVVIVSAVQFGWVPVASNSSNAASLNLLPVATSSLTPTATSTPTLPPTVTPTPTATPTPTPRVLTPLPIAQPVWDGVQRSLNVPILMYHYISAPPTLTDLLRVGLSVPPETFAAQMKMLADNGYHTVTLLDVYDSLATGKELPTNPVVLTFDDGYVDNYQFAFPILQKYGFVGTFFILTGPPDASNPVYMSWDMIKEMSDAGMDIELHSRDHVDLRQRSFEYLFFQIIGGRQSIEGHTGKPVHFMAYPSGLYDSALLQFLAKFDYWAALTTRPGRVHTLQDALTWTRVRISGQLTIDGFAKSVGIKTP
jgi:peptidoglycan/xylan/chitin deacetylase (PgdA/CDA1 family)